MLPDRYSLRHPVARPYVVPLLLVPLVIPLVSHKVPCAVFMVLLFLLLFLTTFWSPQSERFQCFYRNDRGMYVEFQNMILPLSAERPIEGSNKGYCFSFVFQHKKYLLTPSGVTPVSPKLDFTFIELCKGPARTNMYDYFPPNDLRVPNPSFIRLFKEQCVTPLFVFQIVSALLMCFDQHVWTGLFSAAMIVSVEASLIATRLVTLRTFRTLENKDQPVVTVDQDSLNECLQNAPSESVSYTDLAAAVPLARKKISSSQLRPGDIIEISAPSIVPCDIVIISGSCAVNEAMLSGESTPLIKEPLPDASSITFDIASHRKHVLFGRTTIEKVESPSPVYGRVLRTGFDTEQGVLLSKMISAEDIRYDPEALRFILILSSIALLNGLYTLVYSKKSGYPLFIDVVVLFTSSIPFELPMEMSVVVNSLVKKLAANSIFCLEPFRITLAGKVDVCCFDKTGTLTDTQLELKGVVQQSSHTDKVLQCCNSLVRINNEIRGDPVDMAIFSYLKSRKALAEYKTLRQFSFSSEKRRHCTLVRFEDKSKTKAQGSKPYTADPGTMFFAMKGAPEVVKTFLRKVPENYDEYMEYAADGYRVLGLAARVYNEGESGKSQGYYENSLEFAGFVLFGASLKKDAVETCATLKESGHKLVMITGDNLLTARCVGRQIGLECVGAEGEEIDRILLQSLNRGVAAESFRKIDIFARAEPRHKELIVKMYNELGYHTMMVGDGTNDVGALKAANVGVAMLEGTVVSQLRPSQLPSSPSSRSTFAASQPEVSVKPGDASVAAPFTVRSDSLRSIIEIIQYGRSSLVTTIQMYKILALNSVSGAFFMAFADILGVKFSEIQMLALGILSALGFSAISAAKPLSFISKQRPATTIFSRYMFFSIFVQALVHIVTNVLIYRYIPSPPFAEKFEPSTMNTVLFALSCFQTVSSFFCNYIGRPFRENFAENKMMVLSTLALTSFGFNVLFQFSKDLNDALQVVDVSDHLWFLLAVFVFDTLVSYIVERLAFRFFMASGENVKNKL